MKLLYQKLMLVSAFAMFGLGICFPLQYGNRAPSESELDAAAALTRLHVPLQRDTRGVVRWIEATEGEINDEAMRYLPAFPGLEWLEIGGGSVTRSGLANLKSCRALRRLYVHDIDLSGDSLSWLSSLTNLEALSLQHTGIDGKALKNLKAPSLVVLNLSGDRINDDDMDQIVQNKGLEVLGLADTQVGGPGIAKLEGMARLNELNLMNCSIGDSDIESFLTMPNLRIVYASGCNLSVLAVQSVIARFPLLAIFR
jgi:Leucine-rich repeat (LRR) protein